MPTTRWCVCLHLHYQRFLRQRTPRLDGHGVESRCRRLAPFSREAASMAAPVASGGAVMGGARTHRNAPPLHGAHVKRRFRDGVADRLNSSSATPPGQAKTPLPICVVHWMRMSSFDIRSKILMYPMRGSRWYDTKRRPASCLRPPTRNPRRDARICRRPCPRLRQDQPIRLVFDIITATAFIETGV
jgi:hypothetical protein